MAKYKNGHYIHYPKKLVDKLDELVYYTDPEAVSITNHYFIKDMGELSLLLFSDGICGMYRKLNCFWVVDMVASIVPRLTETFYTVYVVKKKDNSFYFMLKEANGEIAYCQHHRFTDLKENLRLCLTKGKQWVLSLPSEQ